MKQFHTKNTSDVVLGLGFPWDKLAVLGPGLGLEGPVLGPVLSLDPSVPGSGLGLEY